MKNKKIEKIIFHGLMLLPFIIFGIWCLMTMLANKTTGTTTSLNTIFDNLEISIVHYGSELLIYEPVYYFMHNIFGIGSSACIIIGYYMVWLVSIEMLNIMYDFILFVPRIIKKLINRGVGE